eukprot:CAMPEP_0173126910 /NCGR_PEP_ID=MMETSP1102-20130122/57457_1 /TAXON_ID=49646 /ORGANISM="Geminigera sp., Strain Caron Lab Isolate" /LENGTH=740 /DNA_ID=CAMNT_0014036387 /DNA_START=163 /DNA_END=2382 /DNA_ORIENTATION=+
MASLLIHQQPKEDARIYSGKLEKKVLAADGVKWQSRFAVLTQDILAFSSISRETRDYWPAQSNVTSDNLRVVFDEHDKDNSSCLDKAEIQSCLATLNMPNSDTTVELLMKQLDPDGSGTLDWEEFQVLAKQAAWSNMVVDYIPLAEILDVSFEIQNKVKEKTKATKLVATLSAEKEENKETSADWRIAESGEMPKTGCFKGVIGAAESFLGMDIDGDGKGPEATVIPPMSDTSEIQFIIRTINEGHNSGRSYVYRVEQATAQHWLDLLLQHCNLARTRAQKQELVEQFGHGSLSYVRAKTKRFYKSSTFQSWAAVLIVGAFCIDVSEAQLLPEDGTNLFLIFFYLDVSITALFTIELCLNVFSHSNDGFREFYTARSNWFDSFIVCAQLFSLVINALDLDFPNAKLLRVLRIVRVFRIFSRFKSLNKLINALSQAIIPVCNAFFILCVFTSIYSIFGTHYFRHSAPMYFSNFKTSMFTMFQVVTGDSWASSISRSMFQAEGEVSTDVAVFFVSYIFIGGVVLFNVVVAVLLDEFISYIAMQKAAKQKIRETELQKMRIIGCLDPLSQTLLIFDDEQHLNSIIDDCFRRLDNDDSGGLNYVEFREGLKHMSIKDRHHEGYTVLDIHITHDDFDVLTENGKLLGEYGEFNRMQFRSMMRGELLRYSRRQMANSITLSDSEEFRSTVMLIKLMELSHRESFKQIDAKLAEHSNTLKQHLEKSDERWSTMVTMLRPLVHFVDQN